MTLKAPRSGSGAGPPPFSDDECTAVGPPSGAMLEALRSCAPIDATPDQAALDELVDLTIEFEEPPTVQAPTVGYGAGRSPATRPRPLIDRRLSLVFLLVAMTLVLLAVGGTLLIRR